MRVGKIASPAASPLMFLAISCVDIACICSYPCVVVLRCFFPLPKLSPLVHVFHLLLVSASRCLKSRSSYVACGCSKTWVGCFAGMDVVMSCVGASVGLVMQDVGQSRRAWCG